MNRIVTIACLTLIAVGLPRVAAAKPKVAILGLALKDDGSGIDERSANVARQVTDAMRKQAKARSGPYSLAPGGEKELVDAVLLAGCLDANAACMVKIGSSPDMDTDFLIYGKLEKRDKGYQVSLNLLDVGKQQIVNLLTETETETSSAELERWGKSLYKRLVGESDTGAVVITANVSAGKVFVDDELKGTLVKGEARIQGLEPGSRRIRIESDGAEGESKVTIEAGETAELDVTMEASLPPPPPTGRPGGIWRKIFIGGAVVTGIAGGIWAYSFYEYTWALNPAYDSSYCGDADEPPGGPNGVLGDGDDGLTFEMDRDFQPSCDALSRTFIVGPITVGALALTAVAYYMGYVRPKKPTDASAAARHRRGDIVGRGLSLTPMLSPESAGAVVRFDW
jgi:hypothetical protein